MEWNSPNEFTKRFLEFVSEQQTDISQNEEITEKYEANERLKRDLEKARKGFYLNKPTPTLILQNFDETRTAFQRELWHWSQEEISSLFGALKVHGRQNLLKVTNSKR